jgi:hypothetical protein
LLTKRAYDDGHALRLFTLSPSEKRRMIAIVFRTPEGLPLASPGPVDISVRELTSIGSAINHYTNERAVNLLPSLDPDRLAIDNFNGAFTAQPSGAAGAKVQILPQG